jgi:quercetin dioxygenase-like cupin family protein
MVTSIDSLYMFTYDSCTMNVYHASKGQGLPKHEHEFSHITVCHNGSIAIRKEGKEVIADKYSGAFNLQAGEWHEIEALESNTVFVNIVATDFNTKHAV